MDKPRLIDADRFLAYVNSIRNAHIEKRNEGDECDQFANDAVIDWLFIISNDIEKGVFDYSDPIPLPTIKPGDKVRIIDFTNKSFIGCEAIVERIVEAPPGCAKLKDIAGYWLLSNLEVVE